MRIARRWNARATVAVLLVSVGILLSQRIDNGEIPADASERAAAALDPPSLTMTLSRDRIALRGTTQSAAHEASLLRIASDRFHSRDVVTQFNAGVLLPDYWQPLSLRLLGALAAMESADAVMHGRQITIRGVTADPESLAQRLQDVQAAMPADTTLLDDVLTVDDTLTLDELCQRTFAELNTLSIAFQESSATLRTSSYPSLDRLVDFAWDCQHVTIVIIGHSDASGNESWNKQLSRARAQAVADFLESNGIERQRLVIEGRGSSVPIADNDTAYGRSLNRRIEFQLRLPLL